MPAAIALPNDRRARLSFLCNVYSILAAQMCLTISVCTIMTMVDPIRTTVVSPTALAFSILTVSLPWSWFVSRKLQAVLSSELLLIMTSFFQCAVPGRETNCHLSRTWIGRARCWGDIHHGDRLCIHDRIHLEIEIDFSVIGAVLAASFWIMLSWVRWCQRKCMHVQSSRQVANLVVCLFRASRVSHLPL